MELKCLIQNEIIKIQVVDATFGNAKKIGTLLEIIKNLLKIISNIKILETMALDFIKIGLLNQIFLSITMKQKKILKLEKFHQAGVRKVR